jgi:DNA processing protein
LFAVPGRIDQPSSAGCHQLIRDGATLLTSVDDLLSELSYLQGLRPAPIGARSADQPSLLEQLQAGLSPAEKALVDCFRGGALLGVDQLAARTKLSAPEISAALMMLELKKLVSKRADGTFEAHSAI